MKKLSTLVCGLVLLALSTTSVYAASDSLSFGGTVADEDDVSMALSGSSLADMSESINTDIPVIDVTLSSNNHLGFDVTLSSLNGGELRHSGVGVYDALKDGTFIDYTVTWDDATMVASTGATVTGPISDKSLATDSTVDYSSPSSAADSDICGFEVSTAIKSRLFEGTYSDTVTVTIADNS